MDLALALLVALFVVTCWWAGVRDRYDQQRWKIEPYYPRYGATNVEVLKWWWGRAR